MVKYTVYCSPKFPVCKLYRYSPTAPSNFTAVKEKYNFAVKVNLNIDSIACAVSVRHMPLSVLRPTDTESIAGLEK